jgi:hypothetical protein
MTTDRYNYHRIQAMEKHIKELEDKLTNRESHITLLQEWIFKPLIKL